MENTKDTFRVTGQVISIIVRNSIPLVGVYFFDWSIGIYLYYIVIEVLLITLTAPLRYFWLSDGMDLTGRISSVILLGGLNIAVNLLPCFFLFAIALGLTPGSNGSKSLDVSEFYLPIIASPIEFIGLMISVIWDQILWRLKNRDTGKSGMAEFVESMIFGWGSLILIITLAGRFRGDTDIGVFATAMFWYCFCLMMAFDIFLTFGYERFVLFLRRYFPLIF
ncbi:MAG: hypothetical protein ACOY5B_03775 [Spirochaetota bacterium]